MAVLLAGLVLAVAAYPTGAYSTNDLISHHVRRVKRDGLPAVYDPKATDGPCSMVSCPKVGAEYPVARYGTVLRTFPYEYWVFTSSDTWQWKHMQAMDFKEAFMVSTGCTAGQSVQKADGRLLLRA